MLARVPVGPAGLPASCVIFCGHHLIALLAHWPHPTDLSAIINSTDQNPSWKANSSSSCQQITGIFRNTKVHYSAHNSLSLLPILHEINLVHALLSYFFETRFNIILQTTTRSTKGSSFRFPTKTLMHFVPQYVPHAPPI